MKSKEERKSKQKRRYRNDRSKRRKDETSDTEEKSSDEEKSVEESLSPERSRKSKDKRKNRRRYDSSSEDSTSPEKHVKSKKKTSRKDISSDSEDDRRSRSERKRKTSPRRKKKRRNSSSEDDRDSSSSPERSRKRKKSPARERKRSKTPKKSKRSRSRSTDKRKRRERSRSMSLERRRRRDESNSPRHQKKKKESRKKEESSSRSPEKTVRSPSSKKRARSRSKSKSPARKEYKNKKSSTSPSPIRKSKSSSKEIPTPSTKDKDETENQSKTKLKDRRKDSKQKTPDELYQESKETGNQSKAQRDKEIAQLLESAKLKRLKEKEKQKENESLEKSKDATDPLQQNTDSKRQNTESKEAAKDEKVRGEESKTESKNSISKGSSSDKSKNSETSSDKSKHADSDNNKRNEKRSDRRRDEDRSEKKSDSRHSSSRSSSSVATSKRKEEESKLSSSNKKDENSVTSASSSLADVENEMKKRKERIEAWRNARKKAGGEPESGADDASSKENTEEVKDTTSAEDNKKWSLEDDDDEEDAGHSKPKEESNINDVKMKEDSEDEDLDPLDAFMKTIEKEVKKTNTSTNTIKSANGKQTNGDAKKISKTITVVKTVVRKSEPEPLREKKPEVIEQNQDALEYSSEEETPTDVTAEDFVDTKKKKEIVVDHNKIYYAPFRRDFYVEVPELAKMTPDQVKFYRESLGDIQVRGKNIPKPIKSWAQAGLSVKIMNVLKKNNYEKPTPIQAQAMPSIMSGRDMIGIAKTGSGKTLAFLLPMFRHILDQPALDEEDGPIAIIMTPTRELALQIYREGKKFCRSLQLSIACIYGGSGISEQIAELKRGAEIIVCTPGRMIDMLAANNGKVTNCRRCTYLVLDEADRMFDMGFEPQVMRIIDSIRRDRQTVLFSATFPRQMEAVARKVLQKPVEVQVGGRSVVCSDVEQHAVVIEDENRFFKLLELLGVYQERGSVLVFVEKQESADSLFKDLLKKGYPCLSLHGGMDQYDRDSTIADFKNSVTKLMVSTSVAARGLDVKNLILVINYDCPNHYEDYVHRCGRTGRAGNKGTAFTFLTQDQGRNAGDIIKAFELSKCEPPEDVLTLWNIYKLEMEKEGKKVRLNSGFSGKGFKFNAEEDAQVSDQKKMQKFTLGLQDSDDEAEAAENAMEKINADLEEAFSKKPKIALAPELAEAQKIKASDANVDKDKLKAASDIVAALNKKLSSGQVVDRNTAATAQIMQGGSLVSLKGVGLAKQLADKVNAKLNYKPIEAEPEPETQEKAKAVRYEEEIDINDFPQQARWRITSKEIIEQVREVSEAGVTVRGMYIPPNKKITEDDRRLHLYIESLDERNIQKAKAEIKRLLKEELIKHESNLYRGTGGGGRYKVV